MKRKKGNEKRRILLNDFSVRFDDKCGESYRDVKWDSNGGFLGLRSTLSCLSKELSSRTFIFGDFDESSEQSVKDLFF